jgi:DNA-directed RNA polymerase subunit N (RpoN/RPB10)
VNVNPLMSSQELTNALGLMSGKIIGNDVDLTVARLARNDLRQKRNEFFRGVSFRGATMNFSGLSIQCCVQRQGSMAVVFKPVTFSPTWRKRKNRIKPVECLDCGLFINAKYRRVLRRIHVKTNDIGGLRLEVRVGVARSCCHRPGVARLALPLAILPAHSGVQKIVYRQFRHTTLSRGPCRQDEALSNYLSSGSVGFTVRAQEQEAQDTEYEFAAYGETSPYNALGRLRQKMYRGLATRHITKSLHGYRMMHDKLSGRIALDENGGALVVVDGMPLSIDDLAHILISHEGWSFDLTIMDSLE